MSDVKTDEALQTLLLKDKKRKRKKGKIKKIVIFLIVVACIVFVGKKFLTKETVETIELPPIEVKKEISKNQIQISGYIEAAEEQKLQSPGEGIVSVVKIKEGDIVKKGQLLFSLDSTAQQVQLAKQAFAIEQERINGAARRIALMQQERSLLAKQVKDRSVFAKFDGIVAYLNLKEDQYAKAQDNFGTIIDRSYLKTTVEVSESDAYRLAIGQKAKLFFSALPGIEVEGEVMAFPAIARLNAQRGNTVLDTKIVVQSPPDGVLPGYSFYGSIIVGEDEELLTCSKNAIRYDEGQPYADKILEDGKTEAIKLEISPYIQGFVRIVSGLSEGDKLKDQTQVDTNNRRGGPR